MGRSARDNRPHIKPVEKIQLSEENVGLRIAAVVLLLLLGASALAYAFGQLFAVDPGWQTIEAGTSDGPNCGEEFVFLYELGADGRSARDESRALTELYTQACRKAFQLFNADESFEGMVNLRDINQRPNEALEVDEVLYRALEAVQEAGDRTLYLGPVVTRYDDLFYCEDDAQLMDFDPRLSEEVAEEYAAIAAFAVDPEQIDVELLGENKICLKVSEEYLAHAQREGVDRFLDFGWMRNAFVADYLADTMIEAGFTYGTISSYDGFARCLDSREGTFGLDVLDWLEDRPIVAGTLEYQGPMSLATLRYFPAAKGDEHRYYRLKNGEVHTLYLNPYDGGLCSLGGDGVGSVVSYSPVHSCAELAMSMGQAYIRNVWSGRVGSGEIVCWSDSHELVCTSRETVVTNLYENEDGVRYTLKVGPVPD